MKKEWEIFFDHHSLKYMDEVFTKNTIKEVDFLVEELQLPVGSSIIDIGCGTGRHSIELAKRGFNVTGIDISVGMLKEAEKTAHKEKVNVKYIKADAVEFSVDEMFDAAVCLCEGAFALLGLDEEPFDHDLKILENINASLKQNSKFILTTLNGLKMIRDYNQDDVMKEKFDPLKIIEIHSMEYETEKGIEKVTIKEKGYTGLELKYLLESAGFEVENIWGGTAGNWGKRKIQLDEIEIMAECRKVSDVK
jgi:cyclopropane fatty-acyl-phospholipid synthase-like methyltransferase